MNQKEFFGEKCIQNLSEIMTYINANRIFIVCGKSSFKLSGAQEKLEKLTKGKVVDIYNDFSLNPEYNDLIKGISLFKKNNYDLIIGIGGGSAIDMAKLIKFFAFQSGDLKDYIKGKKDVMSSAFIPPMVAIPTTVGTGSEATHFAVLYLDDKKYSVAHKNILPEFVILDPELTYSLPAYVTACSGMDALCQGIESYWSINSTAESREFSRKAIELTFGNIVDAVYGSESAKEKMLLGANYSGKAINIAKTTAAHALSYALTSYCDIPHGHAVAIFMSEIIKYNNNFKNKEINDPRGIDYLQAIFNELNNLLGVESENIESRIISLMKEIGLSIKLRDICVRNIGQEIFLSGINIDRLKNNPVKLNKADIKEIFNSIN